MTHTAQDIEQARTLYDGGWSPKQISGLFRRRGLRVHEDTIAEWVDPALAERRRERQRQRMRELNARRTGGRLGAGPPRSAEFRRARIESLAAMGVPARSIAKVMSFDFPDTPVSEWHVRQALKTGQPPRPYRTVA